MEIVVLSLKAYEIVAPVVGNAETEVEVDMKPAVLYFGVDFPTFGVVRIIYGVVGYCQGFVDFPVGPGLRLGVLFTIVIGLFPVDE